MAAIVLNQDQQEVLERLLAWIKRPDGPYLSVGGYAGTGKTTLIAYLRRELARLKEDNSYRVAFCCYTGKAASVLRQKLKEVDALEPEDSCGTIHSLIYTAVTDAAGAILSWDRVPSLPAELVVIDEGSMVNESIWRDLLSYRVPILVFGDHGQLPPVEGSFNLMQEPHLRLERIVRQAEDNPIISLSKRVREGGDIPFGSQGEAVRKYQTADPEAWDRFEHLVQQPTSDYLVVCGTNRTRVGLNARIRVLRGFEGAEPQRHDRVVCLKNNHAKRLFNGMLGTVERIEPDGEHWYQVRLRLDDATAAYEGAILRYQFGEQKTLRGAAAAGKLADLPERSFGDLFDFGYALTVHKAQGSEARRVLVFEERIYGYDEEMWRRWLYTAVTRSREELVVFAGR